MAKSKPSRQSVEPVVKSSKPRSVAPPVRRLDGWPQQLSHRAPHKYAVRVHGDCMAPEVCDSDVLIVDHNKKPAVGQLVIIFMNDGKCWVKRLHRLPPEHATGFSSVVLSMNNPPEMFTIPTDLIDAVHAVSATVPGRKAVFVDGMVRQPSA